MRRRRADISLRRNSITEAAPKLLLLILLLIVLFLDNNHPPLCPLVRFPPPAHATMASPRRYREVQSDGVTITPLLRTVGGPRRHVTYDSETGYAVMIDPETDNIVYAESDPQVDGGRLRPRGDAVVGRVSPLDMKGAGIRLAAEEDAGAMDEGAAKEDCGRFCADPNDDYDAVFMVHGLQIHDGGGGWRGLLLGNTSYPNVTAAVAEEDEGWKRRMRKRRLNLATGTLRNLCVLVRFSDHASRPLPSASELRILLNSPSGHADLAPSGSVRDVFKASSYGKLDLVSTVVGWIALPETEAYYADSTSGSTPRFEEMLRAGLNALEAAVGESSSSFSLRDFDKDDDGLLDSVMFLHSGYGAEWGKTDCEGKRAQDRIWSHKFNLKPLWTSRSGSHTVGDYHISSGLWGSCGSDIARIGTIAHEIGHSLGLPDLYSGGSGIGNFGLM